jgi:acetyl-CoA synthetase
LIQKTDNQEIYNIGYVCTGLQCEKGFEDRIALRWIGAHQERADYTFANLNQESSRFANVLQSLDYIPGDVFFTFLPKMPEQIFTFLGSLKMCLITGTLFANFGEDALLDRLGDSGAKGIITRQSFLKKLLRIRSKLPSLQHIILVDSDEHQFFTILQDLRASLRGYCTDMEAFHIRAKLLAKF